MIRDNTSVSHQGAGWQKRHYKVCCSKLGTPWIVPSPPGHRDRSVSCRLACQPISSPGCAAPVQLAGSVCLMELQVASRVLRSSDQKVAGSRCALASQHLQILLVRFSFTTFTSQLNVLLLLVSLQTYNKNIFLCRKLAKRKRILCLLCSRGSVYDKKYV